MKLEFSDSYTDEFSERAVLRSYVALASERDKNERRIVGRYQAYSLHQDYFSADKFSVPENWSGNELRTCVWVTRDLFGVLLKEGDKIVRIVKSTLEEHTQ